MERLALKKRRQEGIVSGLQEGIELAFESKFGAEGLALMPLIRAAERLEVLRQAIRTAETAEQVRHVLTQHED